MGRILLDSVSHELRTPLTTITGSLSALRDETLAGDAAARQELLEVALDASGRLDGIVEDLLSLSRIESGALRPSLRATDPGEIARAAIERAGPSARGREIRLATGSEERTLVLDVALVARLVANLLRNASSYSSPETPIDVSFEPRGRDLAIRVRDYGNGVAEAELEAIFEKFRRGSSGSPPVPGYAAPPAPSGLGLGLAICRGIARAHGGMVSARNAPGGGLEVTVLLPSCVAAEPD
jgi:two-component system sensor histidine kinase KdpD